MLAFFGFANVYAMRVNLSVAIVAMVNNTAIDHLKNHSKISAYYLGPSPNIPGWRIYLKFLWQLFRENKMHYAPKSLFKTLKHKPQNVSSSQCILGYSYRELDTDLSCPVNNSAPPIVSSLLGKHGVAPNDTKKVSCP